MTQKLGLEGGDGWWWLGNSNNAMSEQTFQFKTSQSTRQTRPTSMMNYNLITPTEWLSSQKVESSLNEILFS